MYEESLKFIREKQQSGYAKKRDVKQALLEKGLNERIIINLIGYAYRTDIADKYILENIKNNIYYKEFINGNQTELIEKYKREGKLRNSHKKYKEKNFYFLPLIIFWVGVVFLIFNFYLAILIMFVSAFLFVKEMETTKQTFLNIKTFGKTIWLFVILLIIGFFILLLLVQ